MLCSIAWQYKLGSVKGEKKKKESKLAYVQDTTTLSRVVEKAHKSPKPRLEWTPFE
jgi:hypothetical protein